MKQGRGERGHDLNNGRFRGYQKKNSTRNPGWRLVAAREETAKLSFGNSPESKNPLRKDAGRGGVVTQAYYGKSDREIGDTWAG